MKTLMTTLAVAALLAAPVASQAQGRGGFHGGGARVGGSFHSGGGFRGGSGFRGAPTLRGGGYRYGGYRGYGYRDYSWGLGAGLGLLAGAALAEPWYGYDYGYDAYYAPPVSYGYPVYAQAPLPGAAPQVCGQWIWNPGAYRYDWAPCAPPPN